MKAYVLGGFGRKIVQEKTPELPDSHAVYRRVNKSYLHFPKGLEEFGTILHGMSKISENDVHSAENLRKVLRLTEGQILMRLKSLREDGYIQRERYPHFYLQYLISQKSNISSDWKGPYCYFLAEKGRGIVKEQFQQFFNSPTVMRDRPYNEEVLRSIIKNGVSPTEKSTKRVVVLSIENISIASLFNDEEKSMLLVFDNKKVTNDNDITPVSLNSGIPIQELSILTKPESMLQDQWHKLFNATLESLQTKNVLEENAGKVTVQQEYRDMVKYLHFTEQSKEGLYM